MLGILVSVATRTQEPQVIQSVLTQHALCTLPSHQTCQRFPNNHGVSLVTTMAFPNNPAVSPNNPANMCLQGAVDGAKRPLGRGSKRPIRGGGSARLAPSPWLRPTLGSVSPCSLWHRPGPGDAELMDLHQWASCPCGQWEESRVMDRL